MIADVLRGVQDRQDEAYRRHEQGGTSPTPVLVIIEEAHEFLSDERISKMPFLFQQVARIAKRGRKRWLGLVFVTQLPRHLPPQVLGLVNNWVLHRISDADTITRLRRSVANVDDCAVAAPAGLGAGASDRLLHVYDAPAAGGDRPDAGQAAHARLSRRPDGGRPGGRVGARRGQRA